MPKGCFSLDKIGFYTHTQIPNFQIIFQGYFFFKTEVLKNKKGTKVIAERRPEFASYRISTLSE